MKLRDLDARFLGFYTVDPTGVSFRHVDSIEDAQGVIFQCPLCAQGKECQEEEGRRFFIGVHSVICWFNNPRKQPKVPDSAFPRPGRWYITPESSCIDNLTFCGPGAYSVLLTSGCGWHGFVKDGSAD